MNHFNYQAILISIISYMLKNSNKVKAVLFDLDGTLADTSPDMCASLNRVLTTHKLKTVDCINLKKHISRGALGVIEYASCVNGRDIDSSLLRSEFLEDYKDHSFISNGDTEDIGLVGVILPYITNRYYPEVLTELHEALRLKGYRILLITTDDSEELDEKLIQPYLKEKLIAIITATKPTDKFVEEFYEYMKKLKSLEL